MDSLESEIGQKMKNAVKAILIKFGTEPASGYIDDELPDYVMIMVANKRSRQQMIVDLSLLLGAQTDVFVNWLYQVLQKLKEVTLPATSVTAGTAGKGGKDPAGKRKAGEQKDKKDKKKDEKTKKKVKSPEPKEKGEGAGEEQHTPPHPAQLGGGVSSIQDVFANQFIQNIKK